MKKADGSITMNFQEIHQTLVEAWRPIFARWDGKEEPRYSGFEERFGRVILSEPRDAKRVTGVELRNTIQHCSNNAAAGADSWNRCEWKQNAETMYNQIAEYLNTIEETASEMNNKELIETPIRPEDIRTTQWRTSRKRRSHQDPETCVSSPLQPRSNAHGRAHDAEKRWRGQCRRGSTSLCTEESQEPKCRGSTRLRVRWDPRGLALTASYRDAP